MSDASRRGKRNRTHGHDAERRAAAYIRQHTGWPVATSRAECKGSGADLAQETSPGRYEPNVGGWAIEIKTGPSISAAWFRQAVAQATGGTAPMLWWFKPNTAIDRTGVYVQGVDIGLPTAGWVRFYALDFWTDMTGAS